MNRDRRTWRGAVPALLSEINTMLVLRDVWTNGPLSRAELSRRTGLSKPTVSKIVQALVERGLVEAAGKNDGSPQGGRRARLFRFNPEAGFVLVCVVHEGHLEGALGDCSARFLERFRLNFDVTSAPDEVIGAAVERFRILLDRYPDTLRRLIGVGVSLPGIADHESGEAIYVPGLPNWCNCNVAEPFERAFGVDVVVENESRLMASAEHWFGVAQSVDNFVSISIGEGTGGAVFIDGRLWRGASYMAGEIGHMRLDTGGGGRQPEPPINNQVAAWAFVDRAIDLARRDPEGQLAGQIARGERPEVGHIFEAARAGDEAARRAVADLGYYLGILIGNALLHYDVPLVVMHGPYTQGGSLLLDVIYETLDTWFMPQVERNTEICYSGIEKDIELVGATSLLLQQTFAMGTSMRTRGR